MDKTEAEQDAEIRPIDCANWGPYDGLQDWGDEMDTPYGKSR